MRHPADVRRRRLGLLFLGTALGLLLLGQTALKAWLGQGFLFVVYWLTCFVFTILAMLTALLDAWITRIRARQEQEGYVKGTVNPEHPDRNGL
jgi:hypothetical protein